MSGAPIAEGALCQEGQVHWRGWRQRWEEVRVWKSIINVQGREGSDTPPLESGGGTAGPGAAVLPGGIQERSFPTEPAPGAFVGAGDSQGWPGWASQAARLTSSTTASSRRGGTRVIKTDEATLFSGLEAIVSASGGAGIWIFLGRLRSPTFRPAPLSHPHPWWLWSVT